MNYALEPPREEHIWDFYYELLLGFIDRKGHADVLKQHIEKGFALGIWVHKQRDNKQFLRPDRIAALEKTECWFWEKEPNPALGPNPFVQTEPTKSESAPADIEHKPVPAETKPRRTIVSIDSKNRLVQKSPDGSVEKVVIDEDREQKENEIWQSGYRSLVKYIDREGNCIVPANHIEEGFNLGSWVVRQRLKRNIMPEQRRNLLESLDRWYWDLLQSKWDRTFQLLEQFCEREGTATVPANHIENGVKLGLWINNQKQYYRHKKLDLARKEKLESLPGWNWDKRNVNWENNFLLLQQYYDREGTARVPGGHVEDGFSLGQWVFAQRRMYRNGKLKVERQEKLEQLPGWEWGRQRGKNLGAEKPSHTISKTAEKLWKSMFQLLVTYGKREGHCEVPESHKENGKDLGEWVKVQREARAILLEEHCELLESLDGWMWETPQMPRTQSEQKHTLGKSDTEIDNLAQEAWTTLFGLGTLAENVAVHTAVKKLHNAGMVEARHARPGGPMHATILKAFERNIELGIMDRPTEGKIRAVLTDPEFYEDEDWDMCIEATLTDAPTNREAAMEAAAHWAKSYSGLDFDAFKPGDAIHDSLSAALRRAIQKRIAIRLPRGMVRRRRG